MTYQIPAERMQLYRRTAQSRYSAERALRDRRSQHAWALARQAAALLKEQFSAQQVAVFGSLVHPGRFTQWSDLDLAVWGLTSANWLRAMAAVRALSDEIDISLVDMGCCSPDLAASIARDGVII
jgi:predicted nucleotidyltransferase